MKQKVDENAKPTYSEFYDSRLVTIYDTVCPIDEYKTFYLELAVKLSASSIIDIGCGTGLLTYELDRRGHTLIGVEPSSAMLDVARRRSYTKSVQWIQGSATELKNIQVDLAIMTGHVAQFFLDDESWQAALKAIYKALHPGGHLAFESRNPMVQPWTNNENAGHIDWPSKSSRRKVNDPVAGPVERWMQLLKIEDERVRYENHYLFTKSGEELVSLNELRFRTLEELSQTLVNAGFSVDNVFGNWDGSPVSIENPEFIFVARRI